MIAGHHARIPLDAAVIAVSSPDMRNLDAADISAVIAMRRGCRQTRTRWRGKNVTDKILLCYNIV